MTGTKTLLGIALGVSIAGVAVAQSASPPETPTPQAKKTGGNQEAVKAATPSPDTAMARLDTDKDGRVSSSEASADPTFDSGFAAMDADGDGYVTDNEFHAKAKATSKPKSP
ncbi:hypothetical protein LYSHEL_09650 [Lysobacter helvus]|uniref:EF-hand domain-containing protein n=2 Tax=Lysobacteraceae TaxID=32033 RepID=A0ABM7Q3Y9_9GAMM|nr:MULTISPECIES: EF-hand domain-containing protein [Lysobacter]BCT91941.1 hypothetical protein LYSCAS_09650 [Lysobacter caseinilyticus]BCT95094.1 hypothetical protein LYSHEL_09650 [Lysobacter helvus]